MATQTGSIDLSAVAKAGETAAKTDQYFWFNSTDSGAGEGAGAHITEKTQTAFVADPANGGGNVLIDSDSVDVRDGTTVLAPFGASGASIGAQTAYHTDVNSLGFSLIDNTSTKFSADSSGIYYYPTPAAGGFIVTRDGNSANVILSNASSGSSSDRTATASNKSIAFGGEVSYITGGSMVYKQTEASGEHSFAGGKWAVASGDESTAHGIGVAAEYEAHHGV